MDHSILDVEVVREYEKSSGDTASEITRRLEISRQAAAKITTKIAERGYVAISPSKMHGEEKIVETTKLALGYFNSRGKASRSVEERIEVVVGYNQLARRKRLLEKMGSKTNPIMREYFKSTRLRAGSVKD